jgi:hypothetical protein
MLRACVLEQQGSWDQNLPWAEFSYNNSYKESLKILFKPHRLALQDGRRTREASKDGIGEA